MNILLPTDFSEKSKNAAIYALRTFRDVPCTLYVMHAFAPSSTENEQRDELNHLPPEFYKQFEAFLYSIIDKRENVNHKFKVIFKRDYFIEAVREVVHEHGINLIIMGTKGVFKSTDSVIGKYTEEVMKKVKCPVLAISENKLYEKPQHILFPTDYKVEYNPKALMILLQIAKLSEATIRVLELFNSAAEPTPAQCESKATLKKIFSSIDLVFFTCCTYRKENASCLFDQNKKQTDLMAIVAKNLSVCQKILNEEKTLEGIPFPKKVPLLMLH